MRKTLKILAKSRKVEDFRVAGDWREEVEERRQKVRVEREKKTLKASLPVVLKICREGDRGSRERPVGLHKGKEEDGGKKTLRGIHFFQENSQVERYKFQGRGKESAVNLRKNKTERKREIQERGKKKNGVFILK